MVPHADLTLAAHAVANDNLDKMAATWQGCYMRVDHRIVVREIASAGSPAGDWMFPLKDVPETCCIFYKAKRYEVPPDFDWFEPAGEVDPEP